MEKASDNLPHRNEVPLELERDASYVPQKTNMEFDSQLSEAEFQEVYRMTRSRMYWLVKPLAALLALWILWDPIVINMLSSNPNWRGDAVAFAILVCGSLAYLFNEKRVFKQVLTKLNDRIHGFTLNDEGLEWRGANGAGGFLKWSRFQGWREGRQVIVLEKNGAGFYVLPFTNIPEIERQSLRQLLRNHVRFIPSQNRQ